MTLSRRDFLKIAGASGAAASGIVAFPGRALSAPPGPVAPNGTTLERTLIRPEYETGYVPVVAAKGEPHVLRSNLGGVASPGRAMTRRPVLAFSHLTDVHIVDAQSPARVEWVDRYDDGPIASGAIGGAFRPHETLTAHVAEAMVRALNKVGRGPMTGIPLAFALQTGDNSDNSQLNEVRWNIDLLDGGRIKANSGAGIYEGVQDLHAESYDPHYWHPDGAPGGDFPKTRYGFPTIPGLLGAAVREFTATGLDTPWYTAYGNHDGLVQGNFPGSWQLDNIARGQLKLVTLPPGLSQEDVQQAMQNQKFDELLQALAPTSYVREVSPDDNRRVIDRRRVVQEHFTTTGLPVGHGFLEDNFHDGHAYYTFDHGPFTFIVLDTVNPNGYANGSLARTQFDWLTEQLTLLRDRLIVIVSHHTIDTMDNPFLGPDEQDGPRFLGAQVEQLLLAHPNVVLWVNGHTHKNEIVAHARPDGSGGFWEVSTAAHIEWPQQSRIIEVADNRDGTLSVFCTLVDHAAPLSYGGKLDTPLRLAALSRELSANDWQERAEGDPRRGKPELDRNVELLVPLPVLA